MEGYYIEVYADNAHIASRLVIDLIRRTPNINFDRGYLRGDKYFNKNLYPKGQYVSVGNPTQIDLEEDFMEWLQEQRTKNKQNEMVCNVRPEPQTS